MENRFQFLGLKKYNPLAVKISILIDSWKSKTNCDFISLLEEHTNAWVDLVNRRGFIMSVTNFIYLLKHSKWKPEPF